MAATLEGIPGMTEATKVFVQTVRMYLRDYAELNRLIAGEETNDRMIAWAVLDALSNFNGTPPITAYSIEELFERQQQHLLLRMTVEAIIESVGLLQTRNHLNYSTGGINVGVNDKTPMLMNWLQYFKSFTAQKLQASKVAFNVESILGAGQVGIHSEYWAVNATYLSY
jgi:hypothetical protein